METTLKLSVHQLVDFLLRRGSIDNRVYNERTMEEGTRLHSLREKSVKYFLTEYNLKSEFHIGDITIILEGRADGILKEGPFYIIDEIKSTNANLEEFEETQHDWHLGQAKCYAYMFSKERNLNQIGIHITYLEQGEDKSLHKEYTFSFEELEDYVYDLLNEYLDFYKIIENHYVDKEASINTLDFPFNDLRKGQENLIRAAYEVAKTGGTLFCEAPTGIGKTMATLYPYIKYMGEDVSNKVFYLTAKNSGKEAAKNAVETLSSKGLDVKTSVLSAKEKICFTKGAECNPDECIYAKNYYSKIKEAITFALHHGNMFDFDTISYIAEYFEVCPFELQLDLTDYTDVIICDYNYVFDPISHLKGVFDMGDTNYLLLVDEAHNLVERSKDMYSALVSELTLIAAIEKVENQKKNPFKRAINKLKKMYEFIEEVYSGDEEYVEIPSPSQLEVELDYLYNFVSSYQKISKDYKGKIDKEIKDLYLEVYRFTRIYEITEKSNVKYYVHFTPNVELKIYTLDPAFFLSDTMAYFKSRVLFSATLSPSDYYMKVLGGDKYDKYLSLPSPFPKENFKVIVAPNVSTRYRYRENGYDNVVSYIKAFVSGKVGNYFVFFPSYEYMENIVSRFDSSDINLFIQQKDMSEKDRSEFLSNFMINPEKTTLGFVVMGSIFSEGIDLTFDRLIGVCIVGVGLPRINYESDLIRDYYNSYELDGYSYAYKNPGINKVMQAMGRVIRSESDVGVGLLIDDRYSKEYKNFVSSVWPNNVSAYSSGQIEKIVKDFFKDK
ncbi:MAG: PD-(D/E)XK nuclease family protein [Coprobacillus sp.]|nr:PD-(D/E)XK nuclease family protein [Coprobacillus sp.]